MDLLISRTAWSWARWGNWILFLLNFFEMQAQQSLFYYEHKYSNIIIFTFFSLTFADHQSTHPHYIHLVWCLLVLPNFLQACSRLMPNMLSAGNIPWSDTRKHCPTVLFYHWWKQHCIRLICTFDTAHFQHLLLLSQYLTFKIYLVQHYNMALQATYTRDWPCWNHHTGWR